MTNPDLVAEVAAAMQQARDDRAAYEDAALAAENAEAPEPGEAPVVPFASWWARPSAGINPAGAAHTRKAG